MISASDRVTVSINSLEQPSLVRINQRTKACVKALIAGQALLQDGHHPLLLQSELIP